MLKIMYDIMFDIKTYKFLLSLIAALLILFIFSQTFDNIIDIIKDMFSIFEGVEVMQNVVEGGVEEVEGGVEEVEGGAEEEEATPKEACDSCGKIIMNGLLNDGSAAENGITSGCGECINKHGEVLITNSSNYLSSCTKLAKHDISGNKTWLEKLCQFSIAKGLWTTSANPSRQKTCPNGCKEALKIDGNCERTVYTKEIADNKQEQYKFCPYGTSNKNIDCEKCGMKLMLVGVLNKIENVFENTESGKDSKEETKDMSDFTPNLDLLSHKGYAHGVYKSNTREYIDKSQTNNMYTSNSAVLNRNSYEGDPRYRESLTIDDYRAWDPENPPTFYNALMSLF